MEELDRDTFYERPEGRFSFYVEYDETTGSGWILGISGPGLTAEYSIRASTAEEIVDDWLRPRGEWPGQ